jgi:small redox-active disulfide protein 2
MLNIKVLGPGCNNCKMVEINAKEAVAELGLEAEFEKVTSHEEIAKWKIFSTPGLVINNKVVCAGRIPEVSEIVAWLKA